MIYSNKRRTNFRTTFLHQRSRREVEERKWYFPSVCSSQWNEGRAENLPANILSGAFHFYCEMKRLTKAHWCKRPFQPQWLQITLRRLVPAIAPLSQVVCLVAAERRERASLSLSLSLSPTVQDMFQSYPFVGPRDFGKTCTLGSVWCVFSRRELGKVVTRECLFWGVECELAMEREKYAPEGREETLKLTSKRKKEHKKTTTRPEIMLQSVALKGTSSSVAARMMRLCAVGQPSEVGATLVLSTTIMFFPHGIFFIVAEDNFCKFIAHFVQQDNLQNENHFYGF